ncbi:MAG TPA: PD-(D/E)XK nuclease family protein [Treponemataceae bacterium]|nr:PD-(D/E)XK nuclease family protein [Treponemataceae bacterium]
MSENQAEIQNLLTLVHGISQKYEKIYTKTGLKYNIFKISQIDNKEVIMCKIIADLINPFGRHSQGRLFLDIFLDQIGYGRIGKEEMISISTEFLVDNNRRIDIVIESKNHFIPIEVKVYAGDQDMQCSDYLKYTKDNKKKEKEPVLYYLTLDGKEASEKSLNENDGKYVRSIAFSIHIIEWLEKCIRTKEVLVIAPIREVLQQLIRSIKNLCNIQEDEVMGDEILKEIFSDTKKIQSAIQIQQAMNSLINPCGLWTKLGFTKQDFPFSCEPEFDKTENKNSKDDDYWSFCFENFDFVLDRRGHQLYVWRNKDNLDVELLKEFISGEFPNFVCIIPDAKNGVIVNVDGNIWGISNSINDSFFEKHLSYFFSQREKVVDCLFALLKKMDEVNRNPRILKV